MRRHPIYRYGGIPLCIGLWLAGALGARADRALLSPEGSTLPPDGVKAEFGINPSRSDQNLSWLQFTTSEGIEVELQRFDLLSFSKARTALNVEYPLISDLGKIPAISLGVRDLLGTGDDHRAFYLAVTRTFPLSDRQLKVLREFKLNAGAGTGQIGGPFISAQARFTAGFSLYAELYRRRPNFGLALPLARNMQAKVFSLDGAVYYGLSFTWTH
ncbi:MAG TPA: YjbH domain-containing protein [Chthonomonadaceae bacterium]|nr:YjbH domain-containing protein [Chthonomonadaceae bacterium]